MKFPDDQVRRLLSDPETHATTLVAIIIHKYGSDDLFDEDDDHYGVKDIFDQLQVDYSLHEVPSQLLNKVEALRLAMVGDIFFEDADKFRLICMGLFDGDVSDAAAERFDDFTMAEAVWGMYEVSLNIEDDEDPFYAPSVQRLVLDEIMQEAKAAAGTVYRVLTAEFLQLVEELVALGFSHEEIAKTIRRPFFLDKVSEYPIFQQETQEDTGDPDVALSADDADD